jgi:hypothetical protein
MGLDSLWGGTRKVFYPRGSGSEADDRSARRFARVKGGRENERRIRSIATVIAISNSTAGGEIVVALSPWGGHIGAVHPPEGKIHMAHWFFLSYARCDADVYFKRFRQELAEAVRVKVGGDLESVAFFDRDDIGAGEEWPDTLSAALQHSRIFVPIYTRSYFASDYCGREWEVFRQRQDALMANGAAAPAGPMDRRGPRLSRLPRAAALESQRMGAQQPRRGDAARGCDAAGRAAVGAHARPRAHRGGPRLHRDQPRGTAQQAASSRRRSQASACFSCSDSSGRCTRAPDARPGARTPKR